MGQFIYKKKNRLRTNIQVGNIRLYLQRCESFIGPEGSIGVFLSEVLSYLGTSIVVVILYTSLTSSRKYTSRKKAIPEVVKTDSSSP